jgi:hypothetical protein
MEAQLVWLLMHTLPSETTIVIANDYLLAFITSKRAATQECMTLADWVVEPT